MYNLETKLRKSPFDRDFERLFDVFSGQETDFFAPSCEITDTEKSYRVSLDIPGLKKEEIDIEVKENALYITGERKFETKSEKDNVLRTERKYGKFSRVFSLPQNVNTEMIEARFEDGVLEVNLPKEEKAQSKKIAINAWSTNEELKN